MQKFIITFLVLLLALPAGAESMRERLQKARDQELHKNDKEKSYLGTPTPASDQTPSKNQSGTVREDYANGAPREIASWRRGKRDGETKKFYENGQLQSKTLYKDDLPEGESQSYYSNGKLETEEVFKNGQLHGPRKMYYENGKIKLEETYTNGQLDGTVTAYHTNGRVQSTAEYFNGKQDGKISEYYLAGPIGREVFFQNGKKMWEKKYIYNDKGDDINKQLMINESLFDENGRLKQTNHYDASGKLLYTQ